jgi:hypothetical protein
MLPLPQVAEPLLMTLGIAFTQPTFNRILPLLAGAVLRRGRQTVTAILWTMRGCVPGHFSDYHRVFSRAPWLLWPLGKALAAFVVALAEDHGREGWILVAGDDTVAQAKGKKVYGKGCHHDAVRSTHSLTVWRWGHRWVVLAILVPFPFARRPWALPVLVALYRPKELNAQEGRRHKTQIDLARGLFAALLHWFPEKKFVFLGDGGYASHEFAAFFQRHRRRAALVARFHGDAALYAPPPKYRGQGRPRVKGKKVPTPEQMVASGRLRAKTVLWYSGTKRKVKILDAPGYWYKNGQGLVSLRWVFVRDDTGTRRDEYFYTTNTTFDAGRLIHLFTCRWSIETTFQEMRSHLGFETTRGWTPKTVLRVGPCLLGLFSIVSWIYYEHLKHHPPRLIHRPGYRKSEPTFSDAISEVRRLFWEKTLFAQPHFQQAVQKVSPNFKNFLLDCLCQAT